MLDEIGVRVAAKALLLLLLLVVVAGLVSAAIVDAGLPVEAVPGGPFKEAAKAAPLIGVGWRRALLLPPAAAAVGDRPGRPRPARALTQRGTAAWAGARCAPARCAQPRLRLRLGVEGAEAEGTGEAAHPALGEASNSS